MIIIKNEEQLDIMRQSGKILKGVFELVEANIRPGITTGKLNELCYDYIIHHNSTPSFLNYNGYPASICTSVEEEVVHGIPSERVIEEGQIVGVDIGVCFLGFHTDAARTYEIGSVSPEKHRLVTVTRECFFKGMEGLKAESRLGDLGARIQAHAEANGFSVVRELVGHGVGKELHEDPSIPNYGTEGRGMRMKAGMTIAVEPMINMGKQFVRVGEDGWTVATADKMPSAHYENTLIILTDGVEIITL